METQSKIRFKQVLGYVKKLSGSEKLLLKKAIENEINSKDENSNISELLLQGPIMTNQQNSNFSSLRIDFNKWLENLSA